MTVQGPAGVTGAVELHGWDETYRARDILRNINNPGAAEAQAWADLALVRATREQTEQLKQTTRSLEDALDSLHFELESIADSIPKRRGFR